MSKNEILTATLSTGETVLAKREGDSVSPLRYGNETQALAKIASIRPQLVKIGHRAKVVKQGGRFLVFVFDAEPGIRGEPTWEEVQASLKTPEDQMMSSPHLASMAPSIRKRYVFATISGKCMNPRNRHNHPHNNTR